MKFIKYFLILSFSSFLIAEVAQADTENTTDESEEINNFAPIDFKDEYLVGINIGSTIPFGANLKTKFASGVNIKLNMLTPFGFNLGKKEFKLQAGIDMMKCVAVDEAEYGDYSLTLFSTKLITNISILNLSIGTGLASASGTQMYEIDGVYEDYSMTTAFVSGGISYTLPLDALMAKIDMGNINFDISGLKISIFLEGVEVFGAPSEEGTSDLINAGISMGLPVLI
tara:strand:- start:992 stop:1672 length:681 start_codon:yes stop_codon:yes gene_type:complete